MIDAHLWQRCGRPYFKRRAGHQHQVCLAAVLFGVSPDLFWQHFTEQGDIRLDQRPQPGQRAISSAVVSAWRNISDG